MEDQYSNFCKAFKIKYDPNSTFKPRYFWDFFINNTPESLKKTKIVRPRDIVKLKPCIEERDKLRFIGFLTHDNTGKRVTISNLNKTRLLLGEKAYNRCKNDNISTRWRI